MKTTSIINLKSLSSLMLAFVLILGSCNKSDEVTFSTQDNQSVNNDAALESSQEETVDMASSVLNSADAISGRVEDDSRVSCAYILKEVGQDKTAGTIVVNFDKTAAGADNPAGCTDPRGNVRKGSFTITWSGGRWFLSGSTQTITFNNYSINGLVISGSRTITNVSTQESPLTWNISGTLTTTWPDKTTATRTVSRTKKWVRSTTIADDKVVISQTAGAAAAATGTNRYGKSYSVKITTPLEYSTSCLLTNKVYIPVKGVKEITTDTKMYTVDFGAGTCDNTYTVTLNGKSKEFTAKNDSSND